MKKQKENDLAELSDEMLLERVNIINRLVAEREKDLHQMEKFLLYVKKEIKRRGLVLAVEPKKPKSPSIHGKATKFTENR